MNGEVSIYFAPGAKLSDTPTLHTSNSAHRNLKCPLLSAQRRLFAGMDDDGTNRFGWALALAGPATPAHGFVHFRTIDAVMLQNINGLVGTEFVANHAVLGIVPRQAAGAINPGRANG